MRAYYVTVQDMWMHGKDIVLVVDTEHIPGLILDYSGNLDFYALKRKLKIGEKILVGIARDYSCITTKEEFRFCA